MEPKAVANVISLDAPPIVAAELDAIVTLAYLAMTVHGGMCDDALTAFRAVVSRLSALASRAVKRSVYRTAAVVGAPRALEDRECDAILDRLAAMLDHQDRGELLVAQARLLSTDLRHLAYKIVYAIALVDLDESHAERQFLADTVAALDIDRATAAGLVDEVVATLSA